MRLLVGGGDITTLLRDMLGKAERGELDGVVVCLALRNEEVMWASGTRDDAPHIWSRLAASVGAASHDIHDGNIGLGG